MQKVILIEQDKCTGCRLCEMVCSVKHEGVSNPSRARISIIKWFMEGFHMPMVCQHCMEAPCIAVCPKDRVIKCDLCDGDPQCVKFCFPGALEFVDASAVNLRKKREAAAKLAELMSKVTV
jgi:carbon-monoxide dehydrogenase iron sulfur subunit